eukprot:634487-Rhodomonas_salina.1
MSVQHATQQARSTAGHVQYRASHSTRVASYLDQVADLWRLQYTRPVVFLPLPFLLPLPPTDPAPRPFDPPPERDEFKRVRNRPILRAGTAEALSAPDTAERTRRMIGVPCRASEKEE